MTAVSVTALFLQKKCNGVTHTHPLHGTLSGTTRVSRYQKGRTNLDFTGARDSEWQWHHLGHMQVCTLLQTDNHASTPPLSFLRAGCPSCRPTNSVKALKARCNGVTHTEKFLKCEHVPFEIHEHTDMLITILCISFLAK